MKNKIIAFLLFSSVVLNAQQTNYGFSSEPLLWSPHTPVMATSNSGLFGPHIFYVGTNNRICEYFWGTTWTGGGQLEWGATTVKVGTKIASNGNGEIYFVGSADNKIYKLSWNSSTGWNTSLLVSASEQVRSDANIIFYNNHIFYIGTSNRLCDVSFNGSAWIGGVALVNSPAVVARAGSQIIADGSHVFYIGSNSHVCECFWNGSVWTGGGQLEWGTNLVKSGSQITNNGSEIFFVGSADSKVYDLKYTTSWAATVALATAPIVRTGTDLVYYHENIYYVSNSSPSTNKVVNIKRSGSIWSSGSLPHYGSLDVAFSTPLTVTSKNIYKEGSATTTFESVQVSYSSASANRIQYLISDYDNKNDPNETGSIVWFAGGLNNTANTISANKLIATPDNGKSFFYVGFDGYLNIFARNIINAVDKPGWIITFDQELNIADPTLSTLKTDWNYAGGPLYDLTYNPSSPNISYITDFRSDNIEVNNNILRMSNKQESYNGWQWGEYYLYGGLNYWYWWNYDAASYKGYTHFDYTSSNIQTGAQNERGAPSSGFHAFVYPAPPYEPATFTQAYGYYEIRCKLPRGQKTWNAFWLLSTITNPPEVDILEIGGNGKYWIMSNYWGPYGSGQQTNDKEYPVGYRYYDDYYTFALEWNPTKLTWLLNNQPVLTKTSNIPSDPVKIINGTGVYNNVDLNEILNFVTNNFDIDYIRAYKDDPTRSFSSNTASESLNKDTDFSIYPNPAQKEIIIKGERFSKAEIYNTQGQKVNESSTPSINIDALSFGTYFIKIVDLNGKIYNSQFIKE